MRARLSVVGFVIVLGLCISIPTAGAAVGAAQNGSTNVPVSVGLCLQGGWQNRTNVQGQPFGNQGQCISYFIHNPVSLADLAGSFSGTTSLTIGVPGCLFVQPFDAIYPGSAAVGAVTLNLEGCDVNEGDFQFAYIGTFSIATNVGTLSGNASGPVNNVFGGPPDDFELTLTVLSGTGAFAATTGTIHVSILFFETTSVTGSVTLP